MAFGDPAEHCVSALLTFQFVLELSAPGWTVGPRWVRIGRNRNCGPAPAIGQAENVLEGPCAVWQTFPGVPVSTV